jgi:hypothetical protein
MIRRVKLFFRMIKRMRRRELIMRRGRVLGV